MEFLWGRLMVETWKNRGPWVGPILYRSIFAKQGLSGVFDKSLTQVMNALRPGGVEERMLIWEAAQGRTRVRMEGWWAEGTRAELKLSSKNSVKCPWLANPRFFSQ